MRSIFITTLGAILLASCQTPEKKVTERPGEPDIVYVESDDEKMNIAIQKAQDTWEEFLKIIQEKKYDEGVASVKLRYPTNDGNGEHIWANSLHMIGNDLYAVIDNVPEKIKGLSLGERSISNFTSWLKMNNFLAIACTFNFISGNQQIEKELPHES